MHPYQALLDKRNGIQKRYSVGDNKRVFSIYLSMYLYIYIHIYMYTFFSLYLFHFGNNLIVSDRVPFLFLKLVGAIFFFEISYWLVMLDYLNLNLFDQDCFDDLISQLSHKRFDAIVSNANTFTSMYIYKFYTRK